jgi:hypothetical protein
MPRFAEIHTQTNEVLRVIAAETQQWCEDRLGGTWIATEGKNYPGKGYIYHPDKENFSPPQPYPSWTLDDTYHWQPPVPHPVDAHEYRWDEESQTWTYTHVWATDENGPLEAGDGLVLSSTCEGYFTKGAPAIVTVCDCCDFANCTTETYYSNIASVTLSNVVTTSETEEPGYTENVYWTSSTISHYVGNVVSYYTNVVVYDGVSVYTNVETAQEGFTPVVVSQTSLEPREGFEPIITYSNVGAEDYDANVHVDYAKVITHYSNLTVVEEVMYSNISVAEYANLDTEYIVTPGYTSFYDEASNTAIRVEQYAALTPEQRSVYVVQVVEPVTSNIQTYYTAQTREVPGAIRELEGGVIARCVSCTHTAE